jgi:hypothetical protein
LFRLWCVSSFPFKLRQVSVRQCLMPSVRVIMCLSLRDKFSKLSIESTLVLWNSRVRVSHALSPILFRITFYELPKTKLTTELLLSSASKILWQPRGEKLFCWRSRWTRDVVCAMASHRLGRQRSLRLLLASTRDAIYSVVFNMLLSSRMNRAPMLKFRKSTFLSTHFILL